MPAGYASTSKDVKPHHTPTLREVVSRGGLLFSRANVTVLENRVEDTSGSGPIGLYVQAAKGARIERNTVERSMWGLLVDSEYPQVHAEKVALIANVIRDNAEAGIMIGSPFFPTAVLSATATNEYRHR